jgi:hypothetical protein
MNSTSFTYQGKEYQVDKVAELEPEPGNKYIQIITTDNRQFKLTFKESVFKWVLTESTD